MRVSASADSVRQQHAVEPAVDDAITRLKRDTAPVAHEVGKRVVSYHIYRFWIGSSVAEGLHD